MTPPSRPRPPSEIHLSKNIPPPTIILTLTSRRIAVRNTQAAAATAVPTRSAVIRAVADIARDFLAAGAISGVIALAVLRIHCPCLLLLLVVLL